MTDRDTARNIHVCNTDVAWHFIKRRTNNSEFHYDENRSERAGYPIFSSNDFYCYVCYLDNRLELNIDGQSINFWIDKTDETKASNIIDLVYHACMDTNDFTAFDTLVKNGLVDGVDFLYPAYRMSKVSR